MLNGRGVGAGGGFGDVCVKFPRNVSHAPASCSRDIASASTFSLPGMCEIVIWILLVRQVRAMHSRRRFALSLVFLHGEEAYPFRTHETVAALSHRKCHAFFERSSAKWGQQEATAASSFRLILSSFGRGQ